LEQLFKAFLVDELGMHSIFVLYFLIDDDTTVEHIPELLVTALESTVYDFLFGAVGQKIKQGVVREVHSQCLAVQVNLN
jgi:hypothetical protein